MNQNSVIFEDDLNALNRKVWFGNAEIVKNSCRISDSHENAGTHLISKPFPIDRSAGYLLTFKCYPIRNDAKNNKAGGFIVFYDAAGNWVGAKATPAAAVYDDWNLLSVKVTPEEIPANASTFRIGLQPALGAAEEKGAALYSSLFLKTFTQKQLPAGTIFYDDFSGGTDKWFGGIYEKDGYSSPGSLKIEDLSREAGNNAVSSPFFLDRRKSYVLSGRIKTNGQVTSYSCLYLMMYDSKGNFISALESNMVKTDRWTKSVIKILPLQLPANASSYRIMLQAAAGVAAETGVAWFDNIELKEYSFSIPPEFSAYSGNELAYTDKLFIKGSSSADAYMNPSAMLTDGDIDNFWMPSSSDNAPWLELSHGKKETPCRLVLKFDKENEVPSQISIAAWDDKNGTFFQKKNIILKTNHSGVAEYILEGEFPACRKLKIHFPGKLSGYVSELRYFITPEKRENWHAYWVWAKNQNSTANYEEFTTRVFRRPFELKAKPVKAVIQGRGDDSLELFLNGKAVLCGEELKDKLVPGQNILAARVTNDRYAAGLLAELDILCDDGSEMKIISDHTWKTSLLPVPDSWNTLNHDDSKWAYCEETAQPPFGPWGEIPYVMNSKRIILNLGEAAVPETLSAGSPTVLKFEFVNDGKNQCFQPLTLKISRNNETFFEEVIAEKEFFKDFQGKKMLEYTLKSSEFLSPGIFDMELKMPFHEISFNGKAWKKKISITNARRCSPSTAEIVKQGNLSLLSVNGKINRSIWYTFPYMAGRNTQRLMSHAFGKADCNISQIFAVPRILNRGTFDFTAVDRAVSDALESNPESYIILKTQLNQLYPEFMKEYPQELCTLDNNRKLSYPSHASEVWKTISGEMLKSLIDHINHSPFADRVIGYFILSGEEGQWFHHWGDADITKAGSISDYSPAMLKFFRKYLETKYQTEAALQKAWNMPAITFETAEIPSREKRIRPHFNGMFRTAEDQEAIDFGEALSQCVNETMGFYASIIKKETKRRALVFAYYGHLMDVGDGFLAELGGYLKQQQLLQNPDIDGFAGPLSYRPEFRDIGGTSSIDFPPSGSTRLHNKITIQEDDLRTHLFPKEYAYTIRMPWQSKAVLAREVAKTLCDGAFMYLHEFGTDTRNWFDDPEYLAEIRKLNHLCSYLAEHKNLAPLHEIAVITDDHTLNFLNQKPRYIQRNVPETRAIYMRESISRIGVPFTEYLLSSFLNPDMPDHKLYLFLNTYKITSEQKNAIMRKLARNQASALFLYAPGIIADNSTPDVKNMEQLLGMKIKGIKNWKSPLKFDFCVSHNGKTLEITSGMMSGDSLDDLYVVNDPAAETLARLNGSGESVFAVKKQNGSDIYFASFPFFSPEILRYIAERAKIHVYMDTNDAFYRAGDVFAVHTNKIPGKRVIRLPQGENVRQLYPTRKEIGFTDSIKFHCSTPETRIYEIIK